MPKKAMNALDEVVAERLARQARKSVIQLQAEQAQKSSGKVGDMGLTTQTQKVDLSYIPGREVVKENKRAIERRKLQADAAAVSKEAAHLDWTETDEFGNLIVSVNAQVLELEGIRDPSASGRNGPVYTRGKVMESLNLMADVDSAQSKTFEILEPKRRGNYHEGESIRHPLAKGAGKAKEFELVEPELLVNLVDSSSGQVNSAFIHLNSLAISDEDVFTISRAIPLSSVPKILDLYGNSIQEATGVLTMERINQGIIKQQCNSLETICLANNILGPSMMFTLRDTLQHCRSLLSLDLSNLFEPISDEDGAYLMEGLQQNKFLRNLNLTGNQLGQNFCWSLKVALSQHGKLETLRLDCNEINDDAAFFIADALAANDKNSLHTLSIARNKVDHVGFCRILEAAGTPHSKLRNINVQHNVISKLTSGDIIDALARAKTIEKINISNNKIADMMPMGLGLYLNSSLVEIDLSENNLKDESFTWFSFWGEDKKTAHLSNLRSLDLRQNKLGDHAGQHLVQGLLYRKTKRALIRMDLSDNVIDPLLVKAVQALLNVHRPYAICRREAKDLVMKKHIQDVGYWSERDWEALQRRKKNALDTAVKKLNSRTEDEAETDYIVDEPWFATVPGLKTVTAKATLFRTGVKPVWQLQREMIEQQKTIARKDLIFRKGLVKGLEGKKKGE